MFLKITIVCYRITKISTKTNIGTLYNMIYIQSVSINREDKSGGDYLGQNKE